jgi:hypothetical protein
MDCAAVINLQDQQSHLPPEQASDQKRLYEALLRALIQGKGNQPPIKHGYAHPKRFHPATKIKPARPTIPRSKWDKRLWLNHVADRYASHNFTPEIIGDNLSSRRVFRIRVEDLLSEVMSPDSLFWSSARIPSVNSIEVSGHHLPALHITELNKTADQKRRKPTIRKRKIFPFSPTGGGNPSDSYIYPPVHIPSIQRRTFGLVSRHACCGDMDGPPPN